MTYKIDSKLPWVLRNEDVLQDDVYVNIISEAHANEMNPNGLFSGFLSGDVFFTSKWDGYNFEPFVISSKDVSKVLFLEYLQTNKVEPKDFRKDSADKFNVKDPEAFEGKPSELRKKVQDIFKDPFENTFYPGSQRDPKIDEAIRKHSEDMAKRATKGPTTFTKEDNLFGKNFSELEEIVKKFPKIVLGQEGLEALLKSINNSNNKTK